MTALIALPETRKLATIETIESIRAIPGADAIVCARIRGWDVVVKRDEFLPGDRCVYVEVDAMLDVTDPRFEFLAPRGVSTDPDGRTGHVLKTAKLRGQFSQGLALSIDLFPEFGNAVVGDDVTAALDIVKWDPPIPAGSGTISGAFPSWLPKTDEERVQNLAAILDQPGEWVATEKIDGSSMTAWVRDDVDGVAQRNWDLSANGSFWRTARALELHRILRDSFPGSNAAVQGELFGPGIQGNPLRVRDIQFRAFTVRTDGRELPRSEWPAAILAISVPVYDLTFPRTVDEASAQVETLRSLITPDAAAEGVVWRRTDAATVEVNGQTVRASTKAISRKYLLKHDR